MRNPTIKLALALSSALGGFAAPAIAQEAEEAAAGDIVVTARRVEERLQDVPISMTVFNQEQVTQRNIVNGADLATYTPSLSSNSRFGAETAAFAIRGFTQENFTSPSVATYFADAAPELAHGLNVVNVILVDFRGFDTLGETTVLVTVAIGVRAVLLIGRERRQ